MYSEAAVALNNSSIYIRRIVSLEATSTALCPFAFCTAGSAPQFKRVRTMSA